MVEGRTFQDQGIRVAILRPSVLVAAGFNGKNEALDSSLIECKASVAKPAVKSLSNHGALVNISKQRGSTHHESLAH